jgi:uncharacterized protein (DUF1697 family)
MSTYVAFLRAVNLGAGSTLPMDDLKRLCGEAGLESPRTYIASGNVVFESGKSEAQVKAALEAALKDYAGKSVPVAVRTAADLKAVLEANPFPDAPGNRVQVFFLDAAPAEGPVSGQADDEAIEYGKREIYVRYGAAGIGRSKLKIAAAAQGTARNMNTVAKLVEMAGG